MKFGDFLFLKSIWPEILFNLFVILDSDCEYRDSILVKMDEEIKCVTSSKLAAIYQQTDVIDYLHTIKSGTIYSWRHNVFYKLPDTENNLKSSDLGHY